MTLLSVVKRKGDKSYILYMDICSLMSPVIANETVVYPTQIGKYSINGRKNA